MKMKIHKIATGGREYEFWYESTHKCWYAAEVDQYGNLGESIQEYSKDQIIESIRRGSVPVVHKYDR